MRVTDYTTEIKESVAELQSRLTDLVHPKLRSRCEVLIWLKSGEVGTMKKAIALKGLGTNQGYHWWRKYKEEGLDSFLRLGYKPPVSPLKDKQAFCDDKRG